MLQAPLYTPEYIEGIWICCWIYRVDGANPCYGYIRIRQGFKPARFYLMAWAIGFFAMLIVAVEPLLPYIFLAKHSLQNDMAFEAMIIALALADRIRILRVQAIENLHKADISCKMNIWQVRPTN